MKFLLDKILEHKKKEVKKLLNIKNIQFNKRNVYNLIKKKYPFYISEFKRKSPLQKDIGLKVSLSQQIDKYIKSGTNAISVITDEYFFGGNYQDLKQVFNLVKKTEILILQKDFIIDEKQIQQARICGADLILLIARLLNPIRLIELKKYAEKLGMGVLLELHEADEFIPFYNENFSLIGINNRNLDNFSVCLNRFNVIINQLPFLFYFISESGIQSSIDLAISKNKAYGFLIGTSLMKNLKNELLNEFYQYSKKYFFKSCGLRNLKNINTIYSDLIGVNFSPISKRKIDIRELKNKIDHRLVAVFKENSFKEIQKLLLKYNFLYVQIYSKQLTFNQIKNITCKKIFSFNPNNIEELNEAFTLAKFVDFFILDGSIPGSGEIINLDKCKKFPYPFLLAGGMNKNNLNRIFSLKNCIGVDIASGVETNNDIDPIKVNEIINILNKFNNH